MSGVIPRSFGYPEGESLTMPGQRETPTPPFLWRGLWVPQGSLGYPVGGDFSARHGNPPWRAGEMLCQSVMTTFSDT